jgi:hypothetical protein
MIFKKKTGITAPTAGTCRVDRLTQILLSGAAAPAAAVAPRQEIVAMLTGCAIDIVGIGENSISRRVVQMITMVSLHA